MNKCKRFFDILLWCLLMMIPSLINAARTDDDTSTRSRVNVPSEKYTSLLTHIKSISDKTEQAYETVRLLNDFSVYLIENGDWYLAGPLIHKALRHCPADSIQLRSYITATYASYQYLDGDLEEAESTFKKLYEQTSKDTSQIDTHIRLCINLGEVYQQTGRKRDALRYFERAEVMADSIGNRFLYANAIIHAERLGDNSHIQLDKLQTCVDTISESTCSTLMAPAYMAIARYYFRQGDYPEALKAIDNGCIIAKKLGQLKYQTQGLQLSADVYARQNNTAMSYACMRKVVDLRETADVQRDREIAVNTIEADKILQWSNSVLSGSNPDEKNRELVMSWFWCILSILVCGTIFWWIWKREKKVSKRAIEKLNGEMAELRGETIKLEILYKGFGAILVRIRQALKGMKTDDALLQSKIKDLSSSILQNTLPERKNESVAIAEKEDRALIERLESITGNELNPADRKLAIYLCHGLTTQEISSITGVLAKSVNQSRYRLRRILNLEQEDDLEQVLLTHYREANSQIDSE